MEKKFSILIRVGVWVTAAAFLCLIYSFLPLTSPGYYNSPDESANNYFSHLFAESQVLHFFDQPNLFSPGNAFPRSMRVVGDFTVPVGFVGAPVVFGSVGAMLGESAMPFVTPLLSVLGVFGWFLLVRNYFGRSAGLVAAGLLAVNPIWWYESARTLQPNIMFMALLIWSAYFWLVSPMARRSGSRLSTLVDALLGGLLLGLALAVRTSEAYWIIFTFLVLVAMNWSRVRWLRLLTGLFAAALAYLPFMSINQDLYGSFMRSGYGDVTSLGTVVAQGGLGMKMLGPLQPLLFPLGFAPRTAAHHVWSYGIGFLPWWSAAVAAAVIWLVWIYRKGSLKIKPSVLQWSIVASVISVWLALFYGSWVVRDNPDSSAVTIGSSYFRYWLPVLVFSTLPVAAALARLSKKWPWRKLVSLAVASAYVLFSAFVVFYSPGEGLAFVQKETARYADIVRDLDERLPADAVVITDTADKYIFPVRSVVQPFRSEHARQALVDLQRYLPVYYYGITLPADDYKWLREVSLPKDGLIIEAVRSYDHETLYRFDRVSDNQNE